MFQNGMSEEVQNYFVPDDAAAKVRPYPGDQELFRSQFVDARAQMMGHQQFPQFPYVGNALQHKMSNGDFFDPRMQSRGQVHQQQQQQQHPQQQFFDPVLQQQQQHHQHQQHQQHQQQQYFDSVLQQQRQQQQQQQPQQHQHQQQLFDQSFQAMQMEKLARQQEILLGQGHGLGMQQQQQLVRPYMGTAQVDNYPIRNASIQPPVYGFANDMGQQLMGKQAEASFNGAPPESEAIDNLNDLFGGVEKLFADDPVQESKSAIPGFGSLGASLINGCEAELFGDGTPFFGRGMQRAESQEAFRPAFSLGMQDNHRPSSGDGGASFFGRGNQQQQQQQQQDAFRSNFSLGMQDSNHRPSSGDGGASFFGRGMQKNDSHDAFRPGLQDANNRPSSGGRFSQASDGGGGAWLKDTMVPAADGGINRSAMPFKSPVPKQVFATRQFFPKAELRPAAPADMIRNSNVQTPDNASMFHTKENDEMLAAKVFESSAQSKPSTNALSSPSSLQAPAAPSQQTMQSNLKRVSNDMQRASNFSWQTSGMFGHAQQKPVESDSIYDVVQLQHQNRQPVPFPPAPPAPPTKPEGQLKQDARTTAGEQVLSELANQQQGGQMLGVNSGPVPASNFATMAHAKLATTPQQLQVPKDMQPIDLQRSQSAAASLQSSKPETQLKQDLKAAPSEHLLPGLGNQQPGQILGGTAASTFAAMAHAKLVASQQLLQASKDAQQSDSQRSQSAAASFQSSKSELQLKQDAKSSAESPDTTNQQGSQMPAAPNFATVEKLVGSQRLQQVPKDVNLMDVQRLQNAATPGQPGKPHQQQQQPTADDRHLPETTNQQGLQTTMPAASQQLLQVPKDMQPVDMQRPQQNSQVPVALHQQRVQAALQAYALAKGGAVPQATEQPAGTSATPAKSAVDASVQGAAGQAMKQQLLLNSTFANSVLPKKRKVEVPPLVPWRTAISQLTGALPTIRPAELQWATDTNRLPEKETEEEYYAQDESFQFVARAKQRLKLTTQLMQNSLPPVPAALMQSSSVEDRECAMYVLARLSLGEACRITANEDGPQAKTNTIAATSELIVEGFKDRIKYLERVLQRLDTLPLTQEFVRNMQYLDKVFVTNRLMKCHQELFPVNFTSQRRIQQVQRSLPQPYVTVLPMPSTIPEKFQLVSL